MPLPTEVVKQLIPSPSLGAVYYQAVFLLETLQKINDEDFPEHAGSLRDVFLCIVDHIHDELVELFGDHDLPAGGSADWKRVRKLAVRLHQIYAFIRYLTASSPRQTPPAIQAALAQLTRTFFPEAATDTVCLIRPQWKYNLTYVSINAVLKEVLSQSVLDPDKRLNASKKEPLLHKLWLKWLAKELEQNPDSTIPKRPPRRMAILSFAGLDTEDALFYPLLAHELGHFIDTSSLPEALNLDLQIQGVSHITREQVVAKISEEVDDGTIDQWWEKILERKNICLRELIADLVGLRMMGFAFFFAQAEFLKTVFSWSDTAVSKNGYPEIKFRIAELLRHLKKDRKMMRFLEKYAHSESKFEKSVSQGVLDYLDEWANFLNAPSPHPEDDEQEHGELNPLVESAIRKALPHIERVVKGIIPADRRAVLSPLFFERVERMLHDLPPTVQDESPSSFSEICSAAWAYQLVFGEEIEIGHADKRLKRREYQKTCRLLVKAIESIPAHAQEEAAGDPLSSAPPPAKDEPQDEKAPSKGSAPDPASQGGVLSSSELRRRLALPVGDDGWIAVIPFANDCINGASIDVKLGNWFSIAKKTRLKAIKLGDSEQELLVQNIGKEEVFVQKGKTFLLHPGDLVLGVTKEFIALPDNVMAFVEGKSRLGRLGLLVATAAQIAPGFRGVIVLELVNAGTVPLELAPEVKIAQIVFQTMTDPVPEEELYNITKNYYCQIKP